MPRGGTAANAVIVTGATGLIGPHLLPLLLERGSLPRAMQADRVALDLSAPPIASALAPASALIHTAPIWLLPPWLGTFARLGVRRLVVFSSTSRFTKQDSSSPHERALASRLTGAESAVEAAAARLGLRWTILRPTLIYDPGQGRNVSDIARFVRRWGFFPIAGDGKGRRQPVHAADLATAAVALLGNPATFDRSYDLPGGETLTYAEMIRRIARGRGRKPGLIHVPVPLLRAGAPVLCKLPRWRHVTPDMADRMNEDLVFDSGPARRDSGYDPRPFRPPGE